MGSDLAALLALIMAPAPLVQPAPLTLDAFEAVLARHDSATLALEEWCDMRRFASPARITAELLRSGAPPLPTDVPRQLELGPGETVAQRNVRLNCGDRALSIAWNWYVPDRLTPSMNAALAKTDIPFGKVAASLNFRRKAIATIAGPATNCPPGTISTHQAMLLLPDGRPLAYLVECYTAANLAP